MINIEMKNPVIEFEKTLPHFFSKGTYIEVKGTEEEYGYGLQKRYISKEEDCCDIEYYRWPKSEAPLNECIKLDIDGYNIGSSDLLIAKLNYFNKPHDSEYYFVSFPVHLRGKDYLAEICYFEVGDDYLSFEMLSKTDMVKLGETNLEISIPKGAKARHISEEDRLNEGLILSFDKIEDWLPEIEVYVWEKDGDMEHFKNYIKEKFVLKDCKEEVIKLAKNKEVSGMKLRYESDNSNDSDTNIEWLFDLGDKYLSIRFTFMHDFTYMEVVARGILASIRERQVDF